MSPEDTIRQEAERWRRETWEPSVRERPERFTAFVNDTGNVVEPLYTPADLEAEGFDYLKDLGFPGEFPSTRGYDPSMFRRETPMVSAYSGFGTPEDTNIRYKKLLSLGTEALSLALDLPMQVGCDSDHIMARGEVGRVGVSINTLRDMEVLFDGIPLDSMKRVCTTGNAIGPIMLAWFVAVGEKQGLDPSRFCVHLQNDVLKEYVARGTQAFPIRPAVPFAVDAIEWCAHHAPHWYALTACSTHIDAAGAGSVAATAFCLANAKCYIDEALRRGLTIDQVAPMIQLYLNSREDFFLAVANCRVARRMWARMVREGYGAKDPRSWQVRAEGYAHGPRSLRQEPLNNIVRIALGSLACHFGGAENQYTASFDEALNIPSEEAVTVAIRTTQILSHEYGITSTIDPLGGSYYLEYLCHRMEREAGEIMARVEAFGGAVEAIERGYMQQTITEGAVRRQRAYERGEPPMIGLTKFPSPSPTADVTFQVDPNVERRQIERLQEVRRERDSERVKRALEGVTAAAREGRNTIQPLLEAVRAYASVGEMCGALKLAFGEYQPDRTY